MFRFEVLTVGKELLIGRTLNTNAHWVGARLARRGTMIREIVTVDDNIDEISAAFRAAVTRRPDFLLVIGGLGPTPDDMTLSGIAKALGVKLRLHREALALIREHYSRRGMPGIAMTRARKKMATIPAGSSPVPNERGTAPGVSIAVGRTAVYCVPGVPAEMKWVFSKFVEPEVERRLGRLNRSIAHVRLRGVYESALAPILGEAGRRHPDAYIKSHPGGTKEGASLIGLDVAVVRPSRADADAEVASVLKYIVPKATSLGGTVISAKGRGAAGVG